MSSRRFVAGSALDSMRAALRMRAERDRVAGIEQSIDFVFDFSVGSIAIKPLQVRPEIAALMRELASTPPRTVLEIGTARGGTLFLLSRVAAGDARLMTIDLPSGPFGGGYGVRWVPILKAMGRGDQRIRLVRGDSHAHRTAAKVSRWLGDRPLDFLLIDGDHGYDGARHDFVTYGSLVRPGGKIALHDIVPGRTEIVGEVPRLWERIRDRFSTHEHVSDWGQGGWGIGVCEVPDGGLPSALIATL